MSISIKKRYKVTFLFDNNNLWFEKKFKKYDFKLSNKFKFSTTKNYLKVKNQDIVFPICYTKILNENFLKNNKLTLVVHPSKLPKNKGLAPVAYQVLKNKKKIYVSAIEAVKEVDAGPIFLQNYFLLDGTELSDEIRHKQGLSILKMIKALLTKYPNIKSVKQIGKGNFNKKRFSKDSELDINKTIKQQFNHLRINDNKRYPSFFIYKNVKYIIQIFKKK
tara:strand:- start:3797 stop:4456 length:660 start_codon:yes stop_codon:yes gene_type:complete